MKFVKSSSIVLLFISLIACQQNTTPSQEASKTAQVILATGDSSAIALAKQVMLASGGLQTWNDIPAITWNFFGRRKLLWLKHQQKVRIDFVGKPLKMWVDLTNDTLGQVWMKDHYLTGDSLQDFLAKTKSIWINDSYWLNFPFKLLDEGVRLTDSGADTNMLGEPSHTFLMSFDNVGDTPNNRYKVYVSDSTKLINQWDYFRDSLSTSPDLATTFEAYQRFGGVLLSQKRSGSELSDIQVFSSFDADSLMDLSVEVFLVNLSCKFFDLK